MQKEPATGWVWDLYLRLPQVALAVNNNFAMTLAERQPLRCDRYQCQNQDQDQASDKKTQQIAANYIHKILSPNIGNGFLVARTPD